MENFVRIAVLKALFITLIVVSGCQSTNDENVPTPSAASVAEVSTGSAQIYMFRGGFFGVFSTGITDMATELRRRGVPAQDVNWSDHSSSLAKIKKSISANPKSRPIILAGHSLGASTALSMARDLTSDNIAVDLVIVFDSLGSSTVPKGVRKLISFKASGNKDNPGSFRPGKGFNGSIHNVDIRILPDLEKSNHWNIVNQKELQQRVFSEIEAAYRQYH